MDDPDGPRLLILGAVFIALIFVNAFFAMAETALAYCNKMRLKVRAEECGKRAKAALKITTDFDNTLSALMIGNNVAHVAASTIATLIAVGLLNQNVGAVVATVATTVIILFLGENIPKNIAEKNADKIALIFAYPVRILIVLLFPITVIFSGAAAVIRKLFKGSASEDDNHVTEEDISDIIEVAEEEGVIDEVEGEIIQNAIEFGDLAVRDVLTPVGKVIALNAEDKTDSVLKAIADSGYSRYPVYKGNIDNIIGMLHARTFLKALRANKDTPLSEILFPPYVVSPLISLDDMFAGFREHKTHMAIVADNNKTIGMVTMEDVLEELTGEVNA